MEKQIRIVKKGQDDGNLLYWLSLTVKERMAELEKMRQHINKSKYGTRQGFQRVYRIVKAGGVDFEECYKRRTEAELDGTKVKFLSLEDLITAKKVSGRLQDLADAEHLEKLGKKKNKKD